MTYSKADILKKARDVADRLEQTEQIDFFKRAEKKINGNKKVQDLIKQIKLLQKESVNLQHFQKHEAYKKNEEKIDRLLAELDGIPIVQEFRQSQTDVNDLLQLISSAISEKVETAMQPPHEGKHLQ